VRLKISLCAQKFFCAAIKISGTVSIIRFVLVLAPFHLTCRTRKHRDLRHHIAAIRGDGRGNQPVLDGETIGATRHEGASCQAWYYEKERALMLWEVDVRSHYSGDDPHKTFSCLHFGTLSSRLCCGNCVTANRSSRPVGSQVMRATGGSGFSQGAATPRTARTPTSKPSGGNRGGGSLR